ncbi:MAG: glycosyltransferase 87 family protein, partial [Ktedonobacterales bacterium]
PGWRWLRSRRTQVIVLVVTLAACPTGLHQLGVIATAGFQPAQYSNDGTTLDHYAAMQLLEGHNPYVTVSIISANAALGQDALHTTPLRRGQFAAIPWSSYPTARQIRSVYAQEPAGNPAAAPEFESHVSYPALAFLPLVPFVWAGFPSVVPFFALCLLALVALLALSAPTELRPWVLLLALADAPLLDATVTGDLDVFYILLLFVAWRWWRRPLLSTVFLGLALAAKQLAWFFVPFYAILIWRERGWREAVARLAGAAALFAAINLPFVLNNPHAWLAGVLAPEVDPMFPGGNGLIRLSLGGILPLASSPVYTALELAAMVACIVWYWRNGRRMPELGFVLAVMPLFFAWRSLTTYFYFVALPAVALLLARQRLVGARAPVVPVVPTALAPAPARTASRAPRRQIRQTLPRRLRSGRP